MVSPEPENLFSFAAAEEEGLPAGTVAESPAQMPLDPIAIAEAQRSASQVAYHWNIASDTLTWSGNVFEVLGRHAHDMPTGRLFAGFLDSENFTSRYETVVRSKERDSGQGVPFEIEYMFRPEGKRGAASLWVEDIGRWYGDDQGNPREVYGLVRMANARHVRDQQMNFLSNCDPLTGMMNRGRMGNALGEAISVATSEKSNCAFAIVAIKNLDVMNETYGFEVADEVIIALGERLRKVMRVGDAIARYSGSKFGIILNGCNPDELSSALERFMRAVRDSVIETQLGPVWALLSIGAVSLPALGEDAATAIANAEEALSEAIRRPGDGYVIFTSSEERRFRRALNARCAKEIVNCLRDGLFRLAFQPIVDARSGEVVMHEALLRMRDSGGEIITAGHLVPIAESLGLVRLIDRAVLQLALDTLQAYPQARLSINVSATTANDPRWNVQLLDLLSAAPSLASRLMVEITETAAHADSSTTHTFATRLRACGCTVALDDFGDGYSAIRNLKSLPLTHVKLDGKFCSNLEEGGENRIFVNSMVALAHACGLQVVAEWVENQADCDTLMQLGVDYVQGNFLGEASLDAPWQDVDAAVFDFADGESQPQSMPLTTHPEDIHLLGEEAQPEAHVAERRAGLQDEPAAATFEAVAENEDAEAFVMDDAPAAMQADAEDTFAISPDSEAISANLESQDAEANETALAGTPFPAEDVSEPVDQPELAAIESASVAADAEPDWEASLMADTDDHLSKLREALAALNAAFRSPQPVDELEEPAEEEARLAS